MSSVNSPHGIVVSGNGATVYVVGQGGTDYGGRVLPIATATGAAQPMTGFDKFGISDPASIALNPAGTELLVADAANNWVNPVPLATFADPVDPVRLPPRAGTGHPTDIVFGPANTGAFVVDGFSAVIPFQPGSQTFGTADRGVLRGIVDGGGPGSVTGVGAGAPPGTAGFRCRAPRRRVPMP